MLNKLGGNEGADHFYQPWRFPRKEFLAALIYSEQSQKEMSRFSELEELNRGLSIFPRGISALKTSQDGCAMSQKYQKGFA